MQLEGTTIRIACNQAARDSFVNALGGQPPTLPRAGSVRMPCAIFRDDPTVADHLLTDLGNLDAAHCVIRAGDAAGTVLFEQIVPAANFNPGLTFTQWTAGTAAHFEFVLTPADTNLPVGPLHIAIGVTTAGGGDIPLAYCSTARLRDYGIFNAAAPAAPDYTSWSKSEADARYALRPTDAIHDVYVDDRNGNDSYGGSSADAPLKTLRAARAACLRIGTGARLALARGSHWRESLDLSSLANAAVKDYGTGALPIIDGADPVAGWTKTSGRTNVYQTTVTHDASGGNRLTVYEDGALLARVADQATCDSTEGSFVDAKGSDGSPLTIYLRATDPAQTGNNPNANGKIYEVSVRTIVLALGDGATVSGMQTRRQIDNNGSLDAVNRRGAAISRVLALDGTKHNLGIGSGTVTDCIVAQADAPTSYEASNTAFVAFLNDGTGQSATFRRCGAILQPGGLVSDFYSHGASHPLAGVSYEQVWSLGVAYSEGATIEGSYWRGGAVFPVSAGTLARTLLCSTGTGGRSSLGSDGPVSLSDCAVFAQDRSAPHYDPVFGPGGTATLAHCALAGLAANTNWFGADTAGAATTMTFCVLDGGCGHVSIAAGGSYTGDHNVFRATNMYNANAQIETYTPAGGKETLTAWQAYSGQDLHSVYLKTADQGAGSAGTFWLGHKNAAAGTDLGTVGPAAGDWRVNPAAKVYGAAGTAYVGTFPDGVPITQAGPQTRWDWNARASAAGTPTAWPNVPATVADAQAYILHPDGWVF